MASFLELLLGTHELSPNFSLCAWNFESGNVEASYKNGGTCSSKSLCQLSNDYFLTAEKEKPLIHVWPVNSQEDMKNVRFVLPEPARVVTVDTNSNYLAVGINVRVYVWHLSSGSLLAVLEKHYQPVTCLKFSNTTEYLVTSGQDGLLITYKVGNVLNLHNKFVAGQNEPLYTRNDSSSSVVDVHLGNFGHKSRLVSASLDQTCRVYNLHSGEQLLVLIFSHPLSAVTCDVSFRNLYAGTVNGELSQVHLYDPPRSFECHVNDVECTSKFVGHTKRVTCLDINVSGDLLASGSDDGCIILWKISSRSVLRRIERSGPITNIKFVLYHENFRAQVLRPAVCVKSLCSQLQTDLNDLKVAYVQNFDIEFSDEEDNREVEHVQGDYKRELNNLKFVNKQLYNNFVNVCKKHNKKIVCGAICVSD